jgi:hypothetical protein
MQRLHDRPSQVNNVHAILASAGFQIRGKRATCPYCEGHRSLTVAITDDGLWYCHRCLRGGNVRSLAHQQGVTLPLPRSRKADIPKSQFRAWLSQKMTALGNEERRAYALKQWADAALHFYPEHQLAWNFLRRFCARRPVWERFWELATDKVGRLALYKRWRRHRVA